MLGSTLPVSWRLSCSERPCDKHITITLDYPSTRMLAAMLIGLGARSSDCGYALQQHHLRYRRVGGLCPQGTTMRLPSRFGLKRHSLKLMVGISRLCLQRQQRQSPDVPRIRRVAVRGVQAHRDRGAPPCAGAHD